MNSPFGYYHTVAKTFGWTMHEILWKVPRAQILLMIADQPGFSKTKEDTKTMSGQEIAKMFRK
ncbi:hypothetical protein [Cyclobacterium marinum]|uniref:hypothetical protein n=1 Tax=Cyclobacterium marinum TaxID=104 RepID=UPI0002F68FE9|nr:hypothetical protein [Cyclobacterium marinum]